MSTSISQKTQDYVRKAVEDTDWSFADANTKQFTHEIHRYSGKYIPQVAKRAIEIISEPGDLILDPYVGSGTTLLEANLNSRHSVGVDMSPLAVLITKVKTSPVEETRLRKLLDFFENIAFEITSTRSSQGNIFGTKSSLRKNVKDDSRYFDEWYRKWFTESVLEDLLILDEQIKSLKKEDEANIARVALSNILRRCSNAHSGYPNVMLDKKKQNTTDPIPLFIKTLKEVSEKILSLNELYDREYQLNVVHGDATNLQFDKDFVDAVVTHPPYIGSVPYAEYGSLSLKWLGHDPKALDREITGGKRQSKDVVERFKDGYSKMLGEAHRVLKPNKYLFILVGDPTVKGELIDLSKMTKELAESKGFQIVTEKKRNGINRRANKMGAETILLFQK